MDDNQDEHAAGVLEVGVHRGRRPGVEWTAVTRGVQRPADADDAFVADLRAWQTLLRPAASFTHLTSARLRGWWLPPVPADLPVFVVMSDAQNPPRRPGLDVTRRVVAPESEVLHGLRVATAAEALIACADDVGLIDLVVLIVSALRVGDVTIRELEKLAAQHRRGAPRLRRAIPLVDPRSESPWEVLLGLLHVVCGIDVVPQYELFDVQGQFVARGDLWIVGTQVFHEYDGGCHLTVDQQRKDLRRGRAILDVDWVRRGYTADDLVKRAASILRDADRAVGRQHNPARIRAWHELLHESLFSGAGMARFSKRVGILPKIGG